MGSDAEARLALANAIAHLREADGLAFRLALGEATRDPEIVGAGVARLSTAQTLVAWIPLSQAEAARQTSQLELREPEHQAMYRALPAFRPTLQYYSEGKRWTWFSHEPTPAPPDRSRPGPRQEADPMFALEIAAAPAHVRALHAPDGTMRVDVTAPGRPSRLRRFLGRAVERQAVTVDLTDDGRVARLALRRPRHTRIVVIDDVEPELKIPPLPDQGLALRILELVERAPDEPPDWPTVEARMVQLLRS